MATFYLQIVRDIGTTKTDKSVPKLPGKKWVKALTFIADKMTYHNMKLQGHSKLPRHSLSDVNNSEVKLGLLHKDINNKLLQNCFQKSSTSSSDWQTLKDKFFGITQQLQIEFCLFILWQFNDFKHFLPLKFICMHMNTVHLAFNNVTLHFHLHWCNLYE